MKKERIVYEPLIPFYYKTEFSNHKLGKEYFAPLLDSHFKAYISNNCRKKVLIRSALSLIKTQGLRKFLRYSISFGNVIYTTRSTKAIVLSVQPKSRA